MTAPPEACPRVFIPAGDAEPCSCDLDAGGHKLHHCPLCGVWWSLASEGTAK